MDLLSAYIKTPQLIGILAGCLVFSITISVVIYLLFASGSLAKLAEELQAEVAPKGSKGQKKSGAELHPQFNSIPELYDELINARDSLPLKPALPILEGKTVLVRSMGESDHAELIAISDGRAIFHESSYDSSRIWGWIEREGGDPSAKPSCGVSGANCGNFVIVDVELNRPVGMMSLVDNCPKYLSIRLANIWVTPAFQGQKRAHEAIYLLLEWLVKAGYRRITAETDERNIISRKFLERCGFEQEAVLRKHRIVQNRNSNTALYTVLNSDWIDIERKLKALLGIPLAPVLHKIAEIEKPGEIRIEVVGKGGEKVLSDVVSSGADVEGKKKKKNKKKSKSSNK